MTTPSGRQRLFLHVGLPKSGTSHLQRLLAENRPALREAGFVHPFVRREGMFHAAVELRAQESLWGLPHDLVDGTWGQLLARVRSLPDCTGVISHEIFAGASPEVVDRVLRDTSDLELHVVVTARDLVRQAAAHWQEEVKNGRPWSFAEFEQVLFAPEESAGRELGFWRSQDLQDVLDRWGSALPADRLHLVTAPPVGGDPALLQQRFQQALGLPDGVLPAGVDAAEMVNASLGVVEVALLRQVVEALDGRIEQPAYAHVVKRWFAQGLLAERPGRRAQVPAALAARLGDIATGWVASLAADGVRVHGDLDDLVPPVGPGADGDQPPHPDDVGAEELWSRTPGLVADLLVEVTRLRDAAPAAVVPDEAGQARRRLPLRRRKA